jgi:hypothetical protein
VAYSLDPFHPANRWFRRAFARPAAALPELSALAAVDAAELLALLERLEAEPIADPTARWRFRADALAAASRLAAGSRAAGGDLARELFADLARELRGAARGPRAEVASAPGGMLPPPPPLARGEWVEVALAPDSPFLPAPGDLRWARAFLPRAALDAPPAAPFIAPLIVRLAVALDEDGAPLFLPLTSECLEAGGSGRRWLVDRARALRGEEAWVEEEEGAGKAGPPLETGSPKHGPPLETGSPKHGPPGPAAREEQAARIRRLLAEE